MDLIQSLQPAMCACGRCKALILQRAVRRLVQ